jgi:hypothetical protein
LGLGRCWTLRSNPRGAPSARARSGCPRVVEGLSWTDGLPLQTVAAAARPARAGAVKDGRSPPLAAQPQGASLTAPSTRARRSCCVAGVRFSPVRRSPRRRSRWVAGVRVFDPTGTLSPCLWGSGATEAARVTCATCPPEGSRRREARRRTAIARRHFFAPWSFFLDTSTGAVDLSRGWPRDPSLDALCARVSRESRRKSKFAARR